MNDGIDYLAQEDVLRRSEVLVPTANKGFYELSAEVHRISGVILNGLPLDPKTESDLYTLYKEEWRSIVGNPIYYVPSKHGIRLVPTPQSTGPGVTILEDPALTEREGMSILGDGRRVAFNVSNNLFHHFFDGDGTITGDMNIANVLVNYTYFPVDVDGNSYIPTRYRKALQAYCKYRCFATSEDPAEAAGATVFLSEWDSEKDRAIVDSMDERLSEEYLVSFEAQHDHPFRRRHWEER